MNRAILAHIISENEGAIYACLVVSKKKEDDEIANYYKVLVEIRI